MKFLATLGAFVLFIWAFIKASWKKPPQYSEVITESYKIGIKSLPVLLVIAAFVGTNLALQGYSAFSPIGGQHLVGMFVAMAGVREMAPVIAAAMIAAKAGTEMASQIAVMRIQQQIDALEVMAVNPLWYLISPKLWGIILVLPALTIIAIFSTLLSSYLVTVFQLGLNGSVFIEYARNSITGLDLAVCTFKGLTFGIIISLVSCFFGFNSENGPEGVGKATNGAVVSVSIVIVFLNYLLSELFYG